MSRPHRFDDNAGSTIRRPAPRGFDAPASPTLCFAVLMGLFGVVLVLGGGDDTVPMPGAPDLIAAAPVSLLPPR